MIQNTLLGQCYTQLHNYCQDLGFPSPLPSATDIIATWETDFRPAQNDIETGIYTISSGKTIKQPMIQADQRGRGTMTGLNIRNGIQQRKASGHSVPPPRPAISPGRGSQATISSRASISPGRSESSRPPSPAYDTKPQPNMETRPKISSVLPQTSLSLAVPNYNGAASPASTDYLSPGAANTPTGPRSDYFTRDRVASGSNALAAAAAAKKKPPPPPPKRGASAHGIWVTALYDFAGQGNGDLVFREGDKIRVIKKTDSTDDWWQGELRGSTGSFPANYCQ